MPVAAGHWALHLALASPCFVKGVIPSVKKLFLSSKDAPRVYNLGHSFKLCQSCLTLHHCAIWTLSWKAFFLLPMKLIEIAEFLVSILNLMFCLYSKCKQ